LNYIYIYIYTHTHAYIFVLEHVIYIVIYAYATRIVVAMGSNMLLSTYYISRFLDNGMVLSIALIVSCRSCETIDGEAKAAKEKIVATDDTNKSITFKVIEGDLLKEYKNFVIVFQATPKGEGSLVHWTLEYEKLKDDIPEPNTLLQFLIDVSKDIDAHLTT